MPAIHVEPVRTEQGRRRFVKFPWQVYKDGANWVPPLIPERLEYLDPERGLFHQHAEVALFAARRDGQTVGTIAPFVDRRFVEHVGEKQGGFGFFEVIEDYAVAQRLLDTACQWLRDRGMVSARGPTNFSDNDCPGVLVDTTDCTPVILEAHTPLYYRDFLERYGMEKDIDLYAWRAFHSQIGEELQNLPPQISRVAEFARRVTDIDIRTIRMDAWDEEIATAHRLFTTTLHNVSNRAAMTLPECERRADQFRPFLDPNLALFADVDGESIGFCIAIPL